MQAVTIICNNEAAGLYRITHTPEFQKAQPFCEEILTGSRWLNSLQTNSPYNGPRACECNSALSLLHSIPRCRYDGARKAETIMRGVNHSQYRHGRETIEAKVQRRLMSMFFHDTEELMHALDMMSPNAGRSRGRNPKAITV